jgi:hypothetical protein
MNQTLRTISIFAGLCVALFLVQSSRVAARAAAAQPLDRAQPLPYLISSPAIPGAVQTPAGALRDGSHDFDFEIGSWKIHLKKLMHPLTGSTTWVEFDGTSVTRKIWDGRSQIEEFETDNPTSGHIEGLTLRLYNPVAHQWNLNWATSKTGTMAVPTIGEFKNGRGEFYDYEPINDRMVLVRFLWTNTTTDTPHFEQSFSEDGGKTWEVNWITDETRVKDEADKSR